MDTNAVEPAKNLSSAEAVACSALTLGASAIVAADLLDRIGRTFPPFPMLFLAAVAAVATFVWLRPHSFSRKAELIAFVAVVLTTFGWLLWLARPSLLPLGSGPDLTHHLLLVRFIESHWRLVHDAGD